MSLEFVHAGPYTVVHHQCYQMVDLWIQYCRKTMGGLNPCALPYAPSSQQIVTEKSTNNKKNNKKNAESSKWHACETKKGWRCKNNNNKNKQEKETKIFGNRFNRLKEMAQDNHEVAEVLEKAVDEETHLNINKEENTSNKYDVDSADMHILDTEIQKHAEHDNNEGIQNNRNLNENAEDNSNKTDEESDEEQHACEEESEYDSVKDRIAWRLANPDADSDYSETDDGSVESNFEFWYNSRTKHKNKYHSDYYEDLCERNERFLFCFNF